MQTVPLQCTILHHQVSPFLIFDRRLNGRCWLTCAFLRADKGGICHKKNKRGLDVHKPRDKNKIGKNTLGVDVGEGVRVDKDDCVRNKQRQNKTLKRLRLSQQPEKTDNVPGELPKS